MKLIQSIAIAALALFSAGYASAQQLIYIVGSNGDRQATQTAIANILTGNDWSFRGTNGAANRVSGTVTGLSNATASNYGAWNGTYSGQNVVIRTSFIGAAGAVAALASNSSSRYVKSDGTGATTALIDPYSAGAVLGTDYTLSAANFGFSTNFQGTTPYNGVYNGVTYSTLFTEEVGVSPLVFIASAGFPGTNLTSSVARQLYKNGVISVALLTGNSADKTKFAFALGRNPDSGQRYGAYAEFGLGALNSVTVYQPTTVTGTTTAANSSGTNITYGGTVTGQQLWPSELVSGIQIADGNSGFATGAQLAPWLTATLGSDVYKGAYLDDDGNSQFLRSYATAGYYIGYLTPSDLNARVIDSNIPSGSRGIPLSYNGVAYNTANVKNGSYTAWVYNRILKASSAALTPTIVNNFYIALRDNIKTTTASQGGGIINDSTFLVKRSADGGAISFKAIP